MQKFIRLKLKPQSGAALVEYVLSVGLIMLVALVAVESAGDKVKESLEAASEAVAGAKPAR